MRMRSGALACSGSPSTEPHDDQSEPQRNRNRRPLAGVAVVVALVAVVAWGIPIAKGWHFGCHLLNGDKYYEYRLGIEMCRPENTEEKEQKEHARVAQQEVEQKATAEKEAHQKVEQEAEHQKEEEERPKKEAEQRAEHAKEEAERKKTEREQKQTEANEHAELERGERENQAQDRKNEEATKRDEEQANRVFERAQ
jgi:hypothetical protein